ncbi:MAG: sugar phosphate isomerase/epimerase family protein [Candidatus Hadarchaeales archaeon]
MERPVRDPRLRTALNEATLLPLDAAEFAKIAGEAGFQGVEFRIEKVESREKAGELRGILQRYGLRAVSLNALEDFSLCSPAKFRRMVRRTELLFDEICGTLDCDLVVAVPSFLPQAPSSKDTIKRMTSERLRVLAEMAREHGIRIGFEFLGFRTCSINRLADAWRLVRELNLENLGLVIDTFHLHLSGELLEPLPPQRIFLVHVNDAPRLERNKLEDKHRVLPGAGTLPLKEFLGGLMRTGYRGFLSVELFNREYWQREPRWVASEALKTLEHILAI